MGAAMTLLSLSRHEPFHTARLVVQAACCHGGKGAIWQLAASGNPRSWVRMPFSKIPPPMTNLAATDLCLWRGHCNGVMAIRSKFLIFLHISGLCVSAAGCLSHQLIPPARGQKRPRSL